MGHYQNDAEIERVVLGFESCTTGKDGFSHADHLAVAVWYLQNRNETAALTAMRAGLLRFLNHHGIGADVYSETITRFWILMVLKRVQELGPSLSLTALTNAVVESLTNSRLVFDYYSEGLLKSAEAKCGWVEPDLKAL